MTDYKVLAQELVDFVIHEMELNRAKIVRNNCQNFEYEALLEEAKRILELGLKQ